MSAATSLSSFLPRSIARVRPRTVLIASADRNLRQRLHARLAGLRWDVREAETGAQAWGEAERSAPEAVIVDSWLPDLVQGEFLKDFHTSFPQCDLLTAEGMSPKEVERSPYRQELLYALRALEDTETAAWNAVPAVAQERTPTSFPAFKKPPVAARLEEVGTPMRQAVGDFGGGLLTGDPSTGPIAMGSAGGAGPIAFAPAVASNTAPKQDCSDRLPELVGNADCMLEVSRRIRRVAARTTPVLIEGPTGSGKELVAEALHRLSLRSRKPFVAINCAAIPEALLEAELFGHTRGAFTGAVKRRMGRIEAADGGTLFLDEIGEMPLALQSKLLRFVECGELQRVGDNETVKVDVRILAATHKPLAQHAQEGKFRSDLYFRLAVFLIRTPALVEHMEDLPMLVQHFLEQMGRTEPVKQIDGAAMAKLTEHAWPGNVRELEHVLERAAILAGDATTLTAQEIDFGLTVH
jgi:DNA-binding NtrC family response regulator